jgi:hypothetical protein
MDMKSARVALHVKELVLHGFAPGDRYRIAEALHRELAKLISAGELPRALHESYEVPQVDAGAFPLQPDSRPETVGTQVAQSIYGSWKDKPSR